MGEKDTKADPVTSIPDAVPAVAKWCRSLLEDMRRRDVAWASQWCAPFLLTVRDQIEVPHQAPHAEFLLHHHVSFRVKTGYVERTSVCSFFLYDHEPDDALESYVAHTLCELAVAAQAVEITARLDQPGRDAPEFWGRMSDEKERGQKEAVRAQGLRGEDADQGRGGSGVLAGDSRASGGAADAGSRGAGGTGGAGQSGPGDGDPHAQQDRAPADGGL